MLKRSRFPFSGYLKFDLRSCRGTRAVEIKLTVFTYFADVQRSEMIFANQTGAMATVPLQYYASNTSNS